MAQPRRQSASDWLFLILLFAIVLLSIALPLIVLMEIAKHL